MFIECTPKIANAHIIQLLRSSQVEDIIYKCNDVHLAISMDGLLSRIVSAPAEKHIIMRSYDWYDVVDLPDIQKKLAQLRTGKQIWYVGPRISGLLYQGEIALLATHQEGEHRVFSRKDKSWVTVTARTLPELLSIPDPVSPQKALFPPLTPRWPVQSQLAFDQICAHLSGDRECAEVFIRSYFVALSHIVLEKRRLVLPRFGTFSLRHCKAFSFKVRRKKYYSSWWFSRRDPFRRKNIAALNEILFKPCTLLRSHIQSGTHPTADTSSLWRAEQTPEKLPAKWTTQSLKLSARRDFVSHIQTVMQKNGFPVVNHESQLEQFRMVAELLERFHIIICELLIRHNSLSFGEVGSIKTYTVKEHQTKIPATNKEYTMPASTRVRMVLSPQFRRRYLPAD